MRIHMRLKRLTVSVLLVALILCGAACPALAAPPYEGNGSESAEDAARLYLEGIRDSDLSKALSAFAIETYANHFDYQAQIARIGAYLPASMNIKFPAVNDFAASLNVETRQNELINAIVMQQFMFYAPEMDATQMVPFTGDDREQQVAAFVESIYESVQSLSIETLEVLGFIHPALLSEHYANTLNQENLAKQAKIYGADEVKSVVALFSIGKNTYTMCCDAVRYGDLWYMLSLGGNIGALLNLAPSTGGIAFY